MSKSYPTSQSLLHEDGAAPASAAPRPFTLAAHESVNPIPKLLLSFPVPRVVSQMRLETAWTGEDDIPAGTVNATAAQLGGWDTETLDGVVLGMQQSAQHLLFTGSFSHFFQEQFHHEAQPRGGGVCAPAPSSVACHVSAAVAPGITKLLASVGQQSTVLDVPPPRKNKDEAHRPCDVPTPSEGSSSRQRVPLTRVPKAEMWSRSEEGPVMCLRPRRPTGAGGAWADVSSESTDSTAGGGGSGGPGAAIGASPSVSARRVGAVCSVSSPGGLLPAVGSYEPRTSTAGLTTLEAPSPTERQRHDTATSFAEWLRRLQATGLAGATTAQLLHFISVLPLQLYPFAGIEQEQLSSFLTSLMAEGKEVGVSAAAGTTGRSTRGLLCCQCLAHPHFPTDAMADELVSRTVDAFGSLVRDVSAQLQTEPQRSAAANAATAATRDDDDDDDDEAEYVEDKRRSSLVSRRNSTTNADGSNVAATGGTAAALLPLLEQLRSFLAAFALLLCNPHLRFVADTDVLRLEELCHQCLFRLTRTCTKELHALYASYAMDAAVQLYRCVWNRLESQRQRTVENFFQQLPFSDLLTQRTYQTHAGGRAVLPLSVAVLAAAQSTPLSANATSAVSAEVLQQQCSLWTHNLVHSFLLRAAGAREKAEDAIAWAAAVRLAEDLVDLLGVPEWPGADLLLRSLVMGLAQLTLASESATSTPAEALRPLAVDVLGHVAVRLFDGSRFPVASAILAEMERLGESAHTSHKAARLALQHVIHCCPSLSAEDQLTWERLCGGTAGAHATDGTEADRPLLDLIAAVYMAESRLIASPSIAVDYAAVWFHVRAARLMTWVCLHDAAEASDWVLSTHLDALVRWKQAPGTSTRSSGGMGATPTNWADVCAWTQAISTQSGKSMLSLRMRHTLVSMLLSVFHLKDAHGTAVAVTEVAQKKTLAHLARLTAAHPTLHRYLWPIVRQCLRDDSARVRELIVPFLLTLLSAVAATETDVDAPAAGHVPALAVGGVTAEVISSLLHLLGDKSVSVVSRAISALDAFLMDQHYQYLFVTPLGDSILSFIQHKLLVFASPSADAKHRQEVVKHFLHRWVVTFAASDGSLTGAHAQLAKELVTLTVMSAPDFPYDITTEHPLVQLLQRMHAHVLVHDPSSEVSARGTAAAPPPPKRRSRGYHVDADQLLHVMRCASQSLWMRHQCFNSGDDAVACLATLRVLTLARSEWTMPLAEVLVQSLAYPPPTTSPLASTPEALGGSLLQLCHILHAVLQAPKLPLISLDHLARCLTTLLSKYVGPYQQRVIVASCGALCAMITCGTKHRLSAPVNVPYLQLCYSLMNTYYCRVRALLPTLATQPQSVAYTQRFLFLLSEFLRDYPGWWRQPPHPSLLDDAVGSQGGAGGGGGAVLPGKIATPNQLAKGLGITANTYQLLDDVLQSCGDSGTRERVAVIVLRVVASLCMLDPTTYFHRAETRIRAALTSPDHNLQLQGLSLLSDFLKNEDERVDAASRSATRLDTTALILGTHGCAAASSSSRSRSRSSDEQSSGTKQAKTADKATASLRGRRGSKQEALSFSAARKASTTSAKKPHAAASTTEDFNSGMATWIFQQFHDDIARLSCSSPHVQVRSLCLRLFQQAAQGGSLPPDKYVRVIIALAADVHAPLRQQAALSLAAHCDRHEDVVAASVGRGVVLAFDLHHACGVNLLRSAVVAAPTLAGEPGGSPPSNGEQSVHSALYRLQHKRSRDNMTTTLVRFFHQDGKVAHWCEEHADAMAAWASPVTAAAAIAAAAPLGVFGVVHPLLFLCHLTLVLFTLPYQHESDVMHVLQQCQGALDLNGQAALDWLKGNDAGDAAAEGAAAAMAMRWKAVGSLLLHLLRRALVAEYRLTSTKMHRYRAGERRTAAATGGTHGTAPLRRRDAAEGDGAAASLLQRLEEFVRTMEPALVAPHGKEGSEASRAAWQHVSTELEAALLAETAEGSGRAAASAIGRCGSRKQRAGNDGGARSTDEPTELSGGTARRPAAAKRRRPQLSSSEETSSSADDSEEETSKSVSAARSSSSSSTTASATSCSEAHTIDASPAADADADDDDDA